MLRRVGVNLLYLVPQRVGGTEIYARRLVAALACARRDAEFIIFAGREAAAALPDPEWPANVRVHPLPVRSSVKPLRLAAELALLPVHVERSKVDVLHSLGTTTPFVTNCPRVVTVHDLIYDIYPGAFPLAARLGLKAVVPLGARRAQRVMVSSQATRNEVVKRLRLDPARVDVVPLGLGMRMVAHPTPEANLRQQWTLDERPVVLTVAAALPHKNLDRLVRAMQLLGESAAVRAPILVMVGHAGRDSDRLAALAEDLGLSHRFRMTGWVSDVDLEGLYGLADVFVYPSLHEGFGMPVLEAMRRGVPTACADATSLPEVVGDAAILFDGRSVDAIADAVRELLSNTALATEFAARGPVRAQGFGWDRTAQRAWESYERAVAGGNAV